VRLRLCFFLGILFVFFCVWCDRNDSQIENIFGLTKKEII
jgi:hypothetical protein